MWQQREVAMVVLVEGGGGGGVLCQTDILSAGVAELGGDSCWSEGPGT